MAGTFVGCAPSAAQPQAEEQSQAEEQPQAEEQLTFGLQMFDFSNVFTSYIRKGMETYVKDENIALEVVDAANDMTKQIEQAQTFIQKGVNGLLIVAVDTGGVRNIIDMAKEADIPVVFFDKKPLVDDLNSYDKVYYVGLENSKAGKIQTDMTIDEWEAHPEWDRNGDGVMQYVILMGMMGDEDAEIRTAANREGFAEYGLNVEELDAQIANWDITQAKEVMDTWVVKYGTEMEVIICNNDAMALGVVESLKSAGYLDGTDDKYIPIFGMNGIPDILDMIEDGTVAGTVLSDPWSEARVSLDIITNLAEGKDPFEGNSWSLTEDKSILIPMVPISKAENIDLAQETYKNCR